ACCVYKICYPC
uniref:Conotoxin ar5c n=1 Tax=Conus araneosus TaxID=101286 RepID=CT10C_CONAO|nr:RecName: Full=Conotoxin ar5c [Conus araneosus]